MINNESGKVYKIDGDKIVIGRYPQSVVLDENLISKLKELTITNSNGYYEYNGNEYLKVIANPRLKDYKFLDNETTIIKDNTYYFLVEPIKWKILSDTSDEYFLFSEYILDDHNFYPDSHYRDSRTIDRKNVYANNYEYSAVREWLNNDFYNKAFNNKEKEQIKETLVDNSISSTTSDVLGRNEFICNDTIDKVFLLSYQEMGNASYGFIALESRHAKVTDYILANGGVMITKDPDFGCGFYWLRSPHWNYDYYGFLALLFNAGRVNCDTGVCDEENGIRPAIKIHK